MHGGPVGLPNRCSEYYSARSGSDQLDGSQLIYDMTKEAGGVERSKNGGDSA